MQVPLTGHLREPAHVAERRTGIATSPSFARSWWPLSVVELRAVGVATADALGAVFEGVIAVDGPGEPDTPVRASEQMSSDGRCCAELSDVDRDEFIAASTRRPRN